MPVHNNDIEEILNAVANLLEIKGENPFRVRAYHNAARTVQGMSQSVAEMVRQGQDLSELPGVGKDLAGKIKEIVRHRHPASSDAASRRDARRFDRPDESPRPRTQAGSRTLQGIGCNDVR